LRDTEAEPMHLRDFLKSFMDDEKIDIPLLNRDASINAPLTTPISYELFKKVWEASAIEYEQRSVDELASETAEDGTSADLPPSISDALDSTVSKVENE